MCRAACDHSCATVANREQSLEPHTDLKSLDLAHKIALSASNFEISQRLDAQPKPA